MAERNVLLKNVKHPFLVVRFWILYKHDFKIFPQVAYHNTRNSNLDCMIREPTTFPLSSIVQMVSLVEKSVLVLKKSASEESEDLDSSNESQIR